jgi:hypothetical protein
MKEDTIGAATRINNQPANMAPHSKAIEAKIVIVVLSHFFFFWWELLPYEKKGG